QAADTPSTTTLSGEWELSRHVKVFLLLLQLLVTSGTLGYSLDNPLTYVRKDFVSGKPVKCDACQPGYYLRAHCTATQKSQCAPCPPGSFTAIWNYIDKCLRCGVCGLNEVVKKPCTASNDSQCACKDGYFFHPRYNMCTRHSECPSGQGVLTEGTAEKDTVCHTCPDGTFSKSSSARQNCTQHRSCSDVGLKTVLRGSSWHDSVCGSCEENNGRNSALKQITKCVLFLGLVVQIEFSCLAKPKDVEKKFVFF
uniref:TNFR-Cys domain-containing protein n=1 Tax=Oryzias sinensis TaxID=183150 RepID=A0A8C8DX62_9TELE